MACSTNKPIQAHIEIQNTDDINFCWFLERTKSVNIMQSFYASVQHYLWWILERRIFHVNLGTIYAAVSQGELLML